MFRHCDCCQKNSATKIHITEEKALEVPDDEIYYLCDECQTFLERFLDDHTSTKWIEVIEHTIDPRGGEESESSS